MTRPRFASLALALGLALGAAGTTSCGPKATTVTVPGALNNADAQIYQDMHAAQAAIEQAKMDIAQFPQFKAALNKVIAAYNTAEAAYQTYHATATASTDTTALKAQVSQLMTDIGKLQASIAGAKPKAKVLPLPPNGFNFYAEGIRGMANQPFWFLPSLHQIAGVTL